ncbi:MAG: IS200/IS605 family transposase [Acidobacteriales bacterium]|nr:IS200/IS605 family transposase [Terriglobales bacterium]
MSHSLSSLLTHIIFSTKDRNPCISQTIQPEVCAYIGGIVRELKGKPLIVNGMADHLHLLLQLPATLSIADAMRVIKTNSSQWTHEKWPKARFAWQTGYAAFSVSRSNVEEVIEYIRNQEEHHRRFSFQDELLTFFEEARN